ncbi:unnamed protein product [Moneuplotes crassus]|uniref:Uncharacterized protein n=1 Tax=Euplotes crassus TaxID=5936 RepID=A0AAD1Y935_EUPCR|nr:unnamed protein product [Moneuplotes crassus]
MEKDSTFTQTSELLYKFSHASCILQYYGYFNACEWMMMVLSKKTNQSWQKNRFAFSNLLSQELSVLSYRFQFNSDFANYILSLEKRYGKINYKLEILLIETQSYKNFINFLIKLQNPSKVQFSAIRWSLSNENLPLLNSVHSKLVELGFEESILRTTSDVSMRMLSFRSNTFKITERISYLSQIPLFNLWKMCHKIGSLKIQIAKHLYLLTEIQIPIFELRLESDEAIDNFLVGENPPNEIILRSVRTVCLKMLHISQEYITQLVSRVEGIIAIFNTSEQVSLNEIRISYISRMALSAECIQAMIDVSHKYPEIAFSEIQVGNKHSFKGDLILKNPKICYATTDSNYFFECDELQIEFSKESMSTLNCDSYFIWSSKFDQLIFKNIRQCSFETKIFEDFIKDIQFDKFALFIQIYDQNVNMDMDLSTQKFLISRSVTDYITGTSKIIPVIESPLCCAKIHLTLNNDFVDVQYDQLDKIIERIPTNTRVFLTIMNDQFDNNTSPALLELWDKSLDLNIEEFVLIMPQERIIKVDKTTRALLSEKICSLKLAKFFYKATKFWSREPTIFNFNYFDLNSSPWESTPEAEFLLSTNKADHYKEFQGFITRLMEKGTSYYDNTFYDLLSVD